MKALIPCAVALAAGLYTAGACKERSSYVEFTPEQIEALANCLTEKGWSMYGAVGCSGCIAQQKSFGEAWQLIDYVECDPHEPGNQAERCVESKIRKTPTWILEVDGKEIKRLELYHLLEDLAKEAGCDYPR